MSWNTRALNYEHRLKHNRLCCWDQWISETIGREPLLTQGDAFEQKLGALTPDEYLETIEWTLSDEWEKLLKSDGKLSSLCEIGKNIGAKMAREFKGLGQPTNDWNTFINQHPLPFIAPLIVKIARENRLELIAKCEEPTLKALSHWMQGFCEEATQAEWNFTCKPGSLNLFKNDKLDR